MEAERIKDTNGNWHYLRENGAMASNEYVGEVKMVPGLNNRSLNIFILKNIMEV